MADNKIQMPVSGGGLVRYSDEYASRIMLSPTAVIVMISVFIVVEIFLHI
ncbi:MAG TPA: preprotein translocase subunit Sec61beta [Candidatus Nanoarchaeia archaeon]|nr:preprotein translocase subunit Sec61beta [Candidatus Nanoarchaeia archaeon]